MSLSVRSSHSRVWISITGCDKRRIGRRCWVVTPLSGRCQWSWRVKSRTLLWQAWKHDWNEVLRDAEILIPTMMRCGFWPVFHLKKHPFSNVVSSCVCTSPLAIITNAGSRGHKYPNERFCLEFQCYVYQFWWISQRWFLHVWGSSEKIDFSGFISWKTQPKCRALDDRRQIGPRFNSWQCHGWYRVVMHFSCQSFFFHSHCTLSPFFLGLEVGCSSSWRCA